MHRAGWAMMLAIMLGAAAGCGGSNGSPSTAADGMPAVDEQVATQAPASDESEPETGSTDDGARTDTPATADNVADDETEQQAAAEAVFKFLEMVRKGDPAAGDMLTELAREKTDEEGIQVAPAGSETASFEVSEVELLREGDDLGAHVASTWTDLDDERKPHTDEIIWALRREPEGWRVAGMITKPFEDLPPLVLDFEDAKDMKRQQQLVDQEVQRRMRAESSIPADGEAAPPDAPQSKAASKPGRIR